jgi:aspartate aminotransferase-like enzyme
MTHGSTLQFKIASEPDEFRQIRQLNYRTFVEEIPQHQPNNEGELVDPFEAETTFAVCIRDSKVVGMFSARGTRPFSLDAKLPDVDEHLPSGRSLCELRLLAVEPSHRTGVVFRGLVECIGQHCLRAGYDLALISGTERQLKLYTHLGFIPFGPRVGGNGAVFQPMYLTLETFRVTGRALARRKPSGVVSFLPGPVEMRSEVRQAMGATPVSHRSDEFLRDVADVRSALCALSGARHVQLLLGSGTLANDAVSGQLRHISSRGLVLSNGEFGDRLVDHASRWGLDFARKQQRWGTTLRREDVEAALDADPAIRWVWAVHCETSTGMLNDCAMLRDVCNSRGTLLCIDCISSIGAVPVDLTDVFLATGVSGKALGAPAGIAFVFHNHDISVSCSLPRYLDLGLYSRNEQPPFSQSSNLLRALRAALRARDSMIPSPDIVRDAAWLRGQLRAGGTEILVPDSESSPAVTTVVVPLDVSSDEIGAELTEAGFSVSYQSAYLRDRNWIQICLMANYRRDAIAPLAASLVSLLSRSISGRGGHRAS